MPNDPGIRPRSLPALDGVQPLTGGAPVQWARRVGSPDIPAMRAAASLPLAPGVYRFRDQAGRVLYIGRAVSLRRRVQSYWRDLGDRAHLAPMVARIARVEAVPCDSAHEAAWLERNLLGRRLPPWNRTPGGQEAEVWIRLSDSPRAPGLTVVRRSAPGDFGPYLGGLKVRDAVSGLAFEFAAKLQAELEAVDWITAEQKVAGDRRDQADTDVYGWACGVLVGFEIRGGRMSGWRQRPCPPAAARRYLEQSAPGWAPFALRAAELAARLRSPQAGRAARLRPAPPGTCAG
jgi:excinuclease UvrABC nuclease subunit